MIRLRLRSWLRKPHGHGTVMMRGTGTESKLGTTQQDLSLYLRIHYLDTLHTLLTLLS